MDIKELENIMVSHGVVLRAIPKTARSIYEKYHADKYPDGIIMYLEKYKREMLIVENIPKNAGKFIFECEKHTSSIVKFNGKKFYDSIEQAIEDLVSHESEEH